MHAGSPKARRVSFALGGLLLTLSSGVAPAAGADPLASVPFAVGDQPLFEAPWSGVATGDPGTWSFERGRPVEGRLELHVEITPPRQNLPVASGPAVLFGGLDLYGDAGGDVAIEAWVPAVAHTMVPACESDDACRYSVDISIPTEGLPDAIARIQRDGKLIWVSADMTLVRTFGAGQWLQVSALAQGPGGIAGAAAGRLGAMESVSGSIAWTGLFPSGQARPLPAGYRAATKTLDYAAMVEQLRRGAADDTTALSMVDVALHVRFVPPCPYELELFLHDDHGNHVFHAATKDTEPNVDGATTMPIRSPWYLTLDQGDGVLQGWVELGPIVSDRTPVVLTATIDCVARTATLELIGAATPTPIATRPVNSVGPTASPFEPSTATSGSPPPSDSAPTNAISAALALVVGLIVVAGLVIAGSARRRKRPS